MSDALLALLMCAVGGVQAGEASYFAFSMMLEGGQGEALDDAVRRTVETRLAADVPQATGRAGGFTFRRHAEAWAVEGALYFNRGDAASTNTSLAAALAAAASGLAAEDAAVRRVLGLPGDVAVDTDPTSTCALGAGEAVVVPYPVGLCTLRECKREYALNTARRRCYYDPDDDLPSGLIALCILGVVLCIGVVGAAAGMFLRRSQTMGKEAPFPPSSPTEPVPGCNA